MVGLVKRLFKLYLPLEQLPVLRMLPLGARTPVFLIVSQGRFSRYSWFLRIGPRLPIESDFTGLVRLEVSQAVGRDEALRLADLTSALLPRFVPSRSRDPRAPQNLDIVRKRFEGSRFDTDAFRVADGTRPADVSYAAHMQVTRVEPEVFIFNAERRNLRTARRIALWDVRAAARRPGSADSAFRPDTVRAN